MSISPTFKTNGISSRRSPDTRCESREMAKNAWSKDELRKIAGADDLHISPLPEDGVTYGAPTWIWVRAPAL